MRTSILTLLCIAAGSNALVSTGAEAEEVYLHCAYTWGNPQLAGHHIDFHIDMISGKALNQVVSGAGAPLVSDRASITRDHIDIVSRASGYTLTNSINRMTLQFSSTNSFTGNRSGGTCEVMRRKV